MCGHLSLPPWLQIAKYSQDQGEPEMPRLTRPTIACVVIAALTNPAWGQAPLTKSIDNTAASAGSNYWTTQRMSGARPLTPPHNGAAVSPSPSMPHMATPSSGANATQQSSPGAGPLIPPSQLPPAVKKGSALSPAQMQDLYGSADESAPVPAANSKYGLPFTTSQVQPAATRLSYPFSTAGKLYGTDPYAGDFVCSASVLRPDIMVTAGHCVYAPAMGTKPAHWMTNYKFVPAYDNGTEPFGEWFPIAEGTTASWAGGDGSVPNGQDVGMLSMGRQSVKVDDTRIGDVTGYLGYLTQALQGAAITMLGYPCNLDYCSIMERTDAGSSVNGANNTVIFGSASAGGASGGPWMQDFGTDPVPTGGTTYALGLNRLVSVTSYQPGDDNGGYLGGSILDNEFIELLNMMCGYQANSCP
jgi:V8-like Glu-specific endopeptidase